MIWNWWKFLCYIGRFTSQGNVLKTDPICPFPSLNKHNNNHNNNNNNKIHSTDGILHGIPLLIYIIFLTCRENNNIMILSCTIQHLPANLKFSKIFQSIQDSFGEDCARNTVFLKKVLSLAFMCSVQLSELCATSFCCSFYYKTNDQEQSLAV